VNSSFSEIILLIKSRDLRTFGWTKRHLQERFAAVETILFFKENLEKHTEDH